MSSEKPVHVLFIDDEPGLLSALRDYLQIIHQIEVEISESASEALYNTDIFTYDCLIVDYDMPEIDGISLLKEIRSINPDIPIIVFTGKSREDVVIDALNNGADFYLQKGGDADELFAELAHDIDRCVRRYRAEQALILSEKRYRALIEDQTEFICRLSPDGIITYANPVFSSYLGVSDGELTGKSFFDLYSSERDRILDAIECCDPDYAVTTMELHLETDRTAVRWQQWSVHVLYDSHFTITEYLMVGRDITEKREVERQIRIQRDLGLSMAMASSIESVLDLSLAAASELSGMENGITYLRDRHSGLIRERYSRGRSIQALRIYMGVFEGERKDYLAVSTGSPRYLSMTDMRRYEVPFLSVAFIPIQRYDETVGWFILASDTIVEVPMACRQALESIASQIGNVIQRIEAEEALRDALLESEERYMQLSECSPDAIAILNGKQPVYLNQAALHLFEADSFSDFSSRPITSYLESPFDAHFEAFVRETSSNQPPFTGDGWLRSVTGRKIYGELIAVPITHGGESATLIIIRDKTTHREQEEALQESERRFREMSDLLPEPVFEADADGIITFCNRSAHQMPHTWQPAQPGDQVENLVQGEGSETFVSLIQDVKNNRLPGSCDCASRSPSGEVRHYHISIAPILRQDECLGVRGVLLDITNIRRFQEDLQRIIEEKDILFREIHHRVKNNMQIISSLLQLQEEYIDDTRVLNALQDCEQRIGSLALVHETLYRTDSLVEIPFAVYLESLADAVISSYATVSDIRAEIDVGDTTLSLDTAVTLGLILNEMMVNSMKYAFQGRSSGLISLRLRQIEGSFMLEYRDNGIGLPEGFDMDRSGSLGMRLIRILAKQIQGTVEIQSEPGKGFLANISLPG